MKKIVILEHGGGELANQLWNYASIFAYAIESDAELSNPSFFEYGSQFAIPRTPHTDWLLYRPFRNYRGRRNQFKPQLWRKLYKLWSTYIRTTKSSHVISSINNENRVYYLPPSHKKRDDLSRAESFDTVYFVGWLFRNPRGLEKYRKEIVAYFKPIDTIDREVTAEISGIRKKYARVIGVHVRQGDYKIFKGGKFWIEQKRVREILDEYILQTGLHRDEVCFVITSDGSIEKNVFSGLNIHISKLSAVHDLFLLSKTDTIIGSDSSFGDFASYYGNIPHIVFKNEPIDWEYYKDKKTFFENTYCTMVQY